jgi:hypothetical protein
MIQFSKPISFIEDELFKPQLGTFTLLDGIITDENGVEHVKLQFQLLQNHISGNKTIRTGETTVLKSTFDSLDINYIGNIGDEAACKALLATFNINDLTL